MSARPGPAHSHSYPIAWRTGEGATSSGCLDVADEAIVLRGRTDAEELSIRFDELASIGIGRGVDERVNGNKSLVLERRSGECVVMAVLASFGGVGLLGELHELLARLQAKQRARVAVVVPIKRGSAEAARRLVGEGPPFEIEALGLERHHVFVSEREAVFLFEGENAAAAVDALMRSPDLLKTAVRWRRILAGRPRLADERFGWVQEFDET
jgi:hypothetical protein